METSTDQFNLINGGATPEKIAMLKLRGDLDRSDVFSDPGTPTANGRHEHSSASRSMSRSMARSRQITKTSSRRSTSFISAHRSKMSSELTAQAETKFFSLMELMANASREAGSLKEFWSRILAERESFAQEREELLEQVTEISQELEQRNTERHRHTNDAAERRRYVEKLLAELSIAISSVSTQKKLVADRDLELEKVRRELVEITETHTRGRTDIDKIRRELELIQLTLKTAEGDRDDARGEADQHQKELQRLHRERTEITSKLTDITSKHESSRKEVLSLTDRIKLYETEHDEQIHEIERLKEDSRKARLRADDAAKEVLEITEKLERVSREVTKLKEVIRTTEAERDEHAHTIEHLRREIKTVTIAREEADEKYSDITLKHEHVKRDVLSLKEKLRNIELESKEHYDSAERSRELHRVVVIERDEIRDEVNAANRRTEEARRQIANLTDSLRKAEAALTEIRSESSTLTDRVRHIDIERDDYRKKNGFLHNEISELKQSIVVLEAEIRTITEHRDRIRGDLEKSRREFQEVTEEITSYGDDSHELEFEIESLRTMLREAREQKERAISARNTADRERDEAIAKYEEKCREMERFEESAASHYHAHGRSERSGGSRIVSRSSTTINHGHSSSE